MTGIYFSRTASMYDLALKTYFVQFLLIEIYILLVEQSNSGFKRKKDYIKI